VNSFFAGRWRILGFSKDYFDQDHLFISIFWAVPMSLVAMVIIWTLFVDLCKMMAVHSFFGRLIQGHPKKSGEREDAKIKTE
jgi:hypothetical protein